MAPGYFEESHFYPIIYRRIARTFRRDSLDVRLFLRLRKKNNQLES